MNPPRWMVDSYADWLADEGVRVIEAELAVDLSTVETADWPRMGAKGAVVHVEARGDFCDMHVLDIPPGGDTGPHRHLYEAVYYVVDGNGSTGLNLPDGTRRHFEWGAGSLFALPVNAAHVHFNASSRRRARLAAVTNMPLLVNLFRDDELVFNTPHDFVGRFPAPRYMSGEGDFIPVREHRHMWETNLVPDLRSFDQLRESPGRGAGSTNIQFVIADGSMHAHASEIPPGRYKKAHRHGDGVHIVQLSGHGYSLYWRDGQEPRRVDWKYGILHSPPRDMWHQHFNISDEPARYFAVSFGSLRYPILREKFEIAARVYTGRSDYQIDYEDEDPAITATFDRARREFAAGRTQSHRPAPARGGAT